MLIEKGVMNFRGEFLNKSKYVCDMCRKPLQKQERYLISSSEIGGDVVKKKWDFCEKCMKIIEKNVNVWYSRIRENNKK